jgi:ABC-type glycerol-3-phosphate transport system permease component
MTGAFCLIRIVSAWNAFPWPNIFLQMQSQLSLPVVLNEHLGEHARQCGGLRAGTATAINPPAPLCVALQKNFISGLTTDAVK